MDFIEKAIKKIEEGSISEGLGLLEQYKTSDDENLLFETAKTYAHFGFLDKAEEITSQLLQRFPNDGELLVFSAECFIELGEDERAMERLDQVTQNDENYLSALLLLADLYQSQGLEEVAERKLMEAYDYEPSEPVIWYGLAEFYLNQGNPYKANVFYEKVLNESEFIPDHSIYLHYAESLSLIGEFEKALPLYEKGLESEINLDGLFRFGYTAFKAGEYKAAIQALEKLKSADKQYSTLYPLLAKAYEAVGATSEAKAVLEEGMLEDEHNEELYLELSQLALKSGDPSSAEQNLKKIFQLNPGSFRASQMFISLLKRDERYDEMINHILHLKEIEETEPIFDWELAEAYEKNEEYEKAGKYYDASYPHFKNNSDFLEQYGRFLMEEGKTEEAKTCFVQAIKMDSSLTHLEELVWEMENR
ncbi:hypothetical protein DCC39_06025 [Pueribacillus theae]|uniref:Uncharacterized protein n=1 Tax=Pueribacillus theae TaxID=2171751 RepID=A0A2U1K619_9BACI|nr:tetratricopeptide repeat protein [Pueribacillus theae]PWA12358.1 hypothetical protein DCC39_06025 [Pueribacillus theae]